jgi:hypothetical protein
LRDDVIPALDADEFVFLSLSVETNAADSALAAYADAESFNWVFAVATPELMSALVSEFGQAITFPPNTPHFIIRPDGSTTSLLTGTPAPAAYIELLRAASRGDA